MIDPRNRFQPGTARFDRWLLPALSLILCLPMLGANAQRVPPGVRSGVVHAQSTLRRPAGAPVFTVTNTNNDGTGSLRVAITNANANAGASSITFQIGTGHQTISPLWPLPTLTKPVTIDGTTQPGYAGTPLIEISGASAGNSHGFYVTAGGCTIRGLIINQFYLCAIILNDAGGGNVIQGNYLGTDATGTQARGNGSGLMYGGAMQLGSPNNLIGGSQAGQGNLISGNLRDGIYMGSTGNQVQGNLIGTDVTGAVALGNTSGITLDTATGNTIGPGNVVSGNRHIGVNFYKSGHNTVAGNLLGTNAAGSAPLGNGGEGVYVGTNSPANTVGGTTAADRNVISANGPAGITVSASSGNTIQGNYVGTNAAGTAAVGNGGNGINVQAASANNSVTNNLISGNIGFGLLLSDAGSSGNQVQGNLIGTDYTGSVALGNRQHGVVMYMVPPNTIGGNSAVARNVISANGYAGVAIYSCAGSTVQGNYVGTDLSGTASLGNAGDGIDLVNGCTSNSIAGNLVSGNGYFGIQIANGGSSGNQLLGNYIGTDGAGTHAIPNIQAGVLLDDSASGNIVGGTAAGARNLISGNNGPGVDLRDGGTSNNTISGNWIGTDASGGTALPNHGYGGVLIENDATLNLIGGTAAGAGNVVSGNANDGVVMAGAGVTNNTIAGNRIGTDATGSVALGNHGYGVTLNGAPGNTIGGSSASARNLISANGFDGVVVAASPGNTIQGNSIGTNLAGTVALGNAWNGVDVWGASTSVTIAANLISGNLSNGIQIIGPDASGNTIQGNCVGTDGAGAHAVGNGQGIVLVGGTVANLIGGITTGAGNVISGNIGPGVVLADNGTGGNTVAGNLIGTDATGNAALGNQAYGVVLNGASANTIGGSSTPARNVISANSYDGIVVAGSPGSTIQGNFIGTNAAGTGGLGNHWNGINFFGASSGNSILGNLISSNRQDGIILDGTTVTGNQIQRNCIGTDKTGGSSLGNSGHGIRLADSSSANVIGGATAGSGNTIRYNIGAAVLVEAGCVENSILGNSFSANGQLGIDLSPSNDPDGVTPNHSGGLVSGSGNGLQNYPVLISAAARSGGGTLVNGTLNSAPNTTYRVELFANAAADPSGYGEGQQFLGAVDVTTDASGNAGFQASLGTSASGPAISATATDPAGNTSEFSADVTLAAVDTTPPTLTVGSTTAGPPAQVHVTAQDLQSGLKQITVVKSSNCTISVAPFSVGSTAPVPITATKTNQSQSASFTLQATDVAGNVTLLDPALAELQVPPGAQSVTRTFTGVDQTEHFLTLQDEKPGVGSVLVNVNGIPVGVYPLQPGALRSVDLQKWLRPGGGNQVTLTASGSPRSAVTITIAPNQVSGAHARSAAGQLAEWGG